jgi:hypothetical protein
MSVKVNLPPGCSGFDCKDGTKYTANRPGGSVTMSDRHAAAVNGGQYGDLGLVSAKGAQSFGTKVTMFCDQCNRKWNAWNLECPRCGTETHEI